MKNKWLLLFVTCALCMTGCSNSSTKETVTDTVVEKESVVNMEEESSETQTTTEEKDETVNTIDYILPSDNYASQLSITSENSCVVISREESEEGTGCVAVYRSDTSTNEYGNLCLDWTPVDSYYTITTGKIGESYEEDTYAVTGDYDKTMLLTDFDIINFIPDLTSESGFTMVHDVFESEAGSVNVNAYTGNILIDGKKTEIFVETDSETAELVSFYYTLDGKTYSGVVYDAGLQEDLEPVEISDTLEATEVISVLENELNTVVNN